MIRPANGDRPIFVFGVIWIRESQRRGIKKHGRGLLEGDAMLLDVRRCFGGVPLVGHAGRLSPLP